MKVQKQSYVYYFFLIFFPGIDEIWFYISKLKGVLFFLFDLTNHEILSHLSMPKIFPWIFQQKEKQIYDLITVLMLSNAMATSHIRLIKLKLIKTK